jgi:hypothetical protein
MSYGICLILTLEGNQVLRDRRFPHARRIVTPTLGCPAAREDYCTDTWSCFDCRLCNIATRNLRLDDVTGRDRDNWVEVTTTGIEIARAVSIYKLRKPQAIYIEVVFGQF